MDKGRSKLKIIEDKEKVLIWSDFQRSTCFQGVDEEIPVSKQGVDEEGFLLGVRSAHQWISKGGGQGRGDLKKISGFSELGSFSPSSSSS